MAVGAAAPTTTPGSAGGSTTATRAEFPFLDPETDERWTVRPGAGPIPWWILSKARRIPDTRVRDYLEGIRIARAGRSATVAEVVDPGSVLYRRFWEPLTLAALNTDPGEAAAHLLWPVLRETFGRGAAACRPLIAREGLSETFVDPALRYLAEKGVEIRFKARIRQLALEGERLRGLGEETLGPEDRVVVAVPHGAAAELIPGLEAPEGFRPIVNAHFVLPDPAAGVAVIGLVGGVSHWVFVRNHVASVTVSAGDTLAENSPQDLAERIWPEVARALELESAPLPPWRVVKEKRATFAQTPDQVRRRPGPETRWKNLFLAGDWTDTGLPATIEGAVRSGQAAARAVRRST